MYQPEEKRAINRDMTTNPLLAATGGEAGPKPRVPEVGERFRLRGSAVVYIYTEQGELRRAEPKVKRNPLCPSGRRLTGKAARRAEKQAWRTGRGTQHDA